jgi:hypothetical protein
MTATTNSVVIEIKEPAPKDPVDQCAPMRAALIKQQQVSKPPRPEPVPTTAQITQAVNFLQHSLPAHKAAAAAVLATPAAAAAAVATREGSEDHRRAAPGKGPSDGNGHVLTAPQRPPVPPRVSDRERPPTPEDIERQRFLTAFEDSLKAKMAAIDAADANGAAAAAAAAAGDPLTARVTLVNRLVTVPQLSDWLGQNVLNEYPCLRNDADAQTAIQTYIYHLVNGLHPPRALHEIINELPVASDRTFWDKVLLLIGVGPDDNGRRSILANRINDGYRHVQHRALTELLDKSRDFTTLITDLNAARVRTETDLKSVRGELAKQTLRSTITTEALTKLHVDKTALTAKIAALDLKLAAERAARESRRALDSKALAEMQTALEAEKTGRALDRKSILELDRALEEERGERQLDRQAAERAMAALRTANDQMLSTLREEKHKAEQQLSEIHLVVSQLLSEKNEAKAEAERLRETHDDLKKAMAKLSADNERLQAERDAAKVSQEEWMRKEMAELAAKWSGEAQQLRTAMQDVQTSNVKLKHQIDAQNDKIQALQFSLQLKDAAIEKLGQQLAMKEGEVKSLTVENECAKADLVIAGQRSERQLAEIEDLKRRLETAAREATEAKAQLKALDEFHQNT